MQIDVSGEHVRGGVAPERLTRAAATILLLVVGAAAWVVTVRRMEGMDMGPGTELGGLGWFALVWLTMMAAMMLPSLTPIVVAFARASRRAGARVPAAATVVFTGAYLLVWAAPRTTPPAT
jgi:hypothetical protein